MRGYSITKALNLPEYKIIGIISETDKEIHIRVEPFKRKLVKCGGCKMEHKEPQHSRQEVTVRDKPISGLKVYL